MKVKALPYIGSLILIATFAAAQQSAPGPTPLCSPPPKVPLTNWAQFQFDSCHTGYNPWEFILNSSNVGNLVLDWQSYAGPINGSTPTVVDGMVYIATAYEGQRTNYLYAFNAASGTLVWVFPQQSNGPVRSSAAAADGVVYYGGNPGLYALKATTGIPIWSIPTGSYVSSPTVADGVVYAHWASGGYYLTDALYAVNASNGAILWKHSFGALPGDFYSDSGPAVANGIVYTVREPNSNGGSNVYALSAATGAVLWVQTIGPQLYAVSPTVANGMVYVPCEDQNIYAFNAYTGALIWKYQTAGFANNPAAVANGVLYLGANYLYAFKAANGTLLWKSELMLGNGIGSTGVVANGVVYTGDSNGDLVALDTGNNGALLWKYTPSYGIGPPTVANGILYTGTPAKPNALGTEYPSPADDSSSLLAFHLPGH
jgi:outer membrane protein assembly factor BamB